MNSLRVNKLNEPINDDHNEPFNELYEHIIKVNVVTYY